MENPENWLIRGERSDTYLRHVYRLLQNLKRLESIELSEFSARRKVGRLSKF
jgi:hypothetical protein